MAQDGDHKIKLLLLWDILCRFTDEEHPMNTDEIIEKLSEKGIADSRKVLAARSATLVYISRWRVILSEQKKVSV